MTNSRRLVDLSRELTRLVGFHPNGNQERKQYSAKDSTVGKFKIALWELNLSLTGVGKWRLSVLAN